MKNALTFVFAYYNVVHLCASNSCVCVFITIVRIIIIFIYPNNVHVTLVELPQVFWYSRPEWCRSDIRDFCCKSQQPPGDQMPIALFLSDFVSGRGQTVLFHCALQEVHLPVFQIRRSHEFISVHSQIC